MNPTEIAPHASVAPSDGDLPRVVAYPGVAPLASDPTSIHIKALKEAITHSSPFSPTRSSALYALVMSGGFLQWAFRTLDEVVYSGQPSSIDLFHVNINKAIERFRTEPGLTAEIITSAAMLTLLARYPDYANDAIDFVSSIGRRLTHAEGARVADEIVSPLSVCSLDQAAPGLPFAPNWQFVSELALMMTVDAIAQGKPLSAARFWHAPSSHFMSVDELVMSLRPSSCPTSEGTLRDWCITVRDPVIFWDGIYQGLWDAPCSYRMPELYREIRKYIEPEFRNEWLNVQHVWRIARWSCFRPDLSDIPRATSISSALIQLFPTSPDDPVAENGSCFEKFTEAIWFQDAPQWTSKVPLSWAAALYRVYFDSQRGQKINNVPFEQIILSVDTYDNNWEERHPDFFTIINHSKPVAELKQREGELATFLATLAPLRATGDPVTTLLMAKILGFDHSDFESKRIMEDIISIFSDNEASNLITPLAPGWRERLVHTPRVKRLKESGTVAAVEGIVNRRLQDDKTFARLQPNTGGHNPRITPEQDLFLASPIGVLWGEMYSIERYMWKLYRCGDQPGTRDTVLSLVELLTEVCNGGAYDDIECVRDPQFLEQLKTDLELDSLIQGIRDEFRTHEIATNVTTNKLEVAFKPTRGALTEFVGHLCDTCFSRVSDLAKNAPWVTFVPFVKNPRASGKDGVFPAFAGGSLVIETDAYREDGSRARVFLIRGYNPSTSLLKAVHAASLFDDFSRYLVDVARDRGVSHVLVPEDSSWGLSLTNRPYAFLDIERRFYKGDRVQRMSLVSPEEVALNGLIVQSGVVVAST